MKKIFKNITGFSVRLVMTLVLVSCSSDFLDINTDPNNPSTASLDLLLPSAQVSAGFNSARIINEHASIFVQQFYNLNPSQYNINGSNYSNDFSSLYSQSLKDLQTIIQQGTADGKMGYVGIAKVMKAYVFMIMVDLWGDLPYTDALSGETNLSPQYNDDAFIYDELVALLEEAKTDLNTAITNKEAPAQDLIYKSSYARWIKAANSILLRLYLNISKVNKARATTEINNLLSLNGGDVTKTFISTYTEDFQFVFGNTQAPLTRHPLFQQDYGGAAKTFYMTNYFMYYLISKSDPRLPFYIFRQGTDAQVSADFQVRPCRNRPDCKYGWLSTDPQTKGLPGLSATIANGYIGRDHGDPSGIPGDQGIRATFGVYPIGGSYDRGAGGGPRTLASGASGAGVMPWMTSFMTKFMLAEAALTLGTAGDPKQLMVAAIGDSFAKVEAFGKANDASAVSMPASSIQKYTDDRKTEYDNATSVDQRLNIIITEKYFANFGNGIEAYTDYRRTGKPANLPAPLAPQGPAPVRLLLPPAELTANTNAPNPPPLVTEPIFWDID